ncbi:polysaccharide deacetylase family protein [Salinibacter sp. 10B]|uniref:polysaccharide deacetylase family protein n=1 Tax=Salinibacter sp. 10B TaxID=1923971 RepID=UPI000CF4FE69|nr:polysaccharide deacetylase family protein [Salinibacter sp. 10B]PQJ33732.1 polysaccharide deacetylase family protein [Salinibacter sp. 10B]
MRILVPYLATHGLRPFHRFFPDMLWRVDAQAPTAYLTFDDGPTTECTRALLDTLSEYNAQATHFLLGHHAEQHPKLVEDIVDEGHRVGNHTYRHSDPWTTPQDKLARELQRTTEILEDLVHTPVRALRPPYGHPTGFLREWCAAQNQRMVMWDVMPGDYLQTATADRVSSFVINHVRPGSVIVLHDNPICQDVTPQALDTILDTLTTRGWRFDAL